MDYDDGAGLDPSEVIDERDGGGHPSDSGPGWSAGAASGGALFAFSSLIPRGGRRRARWQTVVGAVVVVAALAVYGVYYLAGAGESNASSSAVSGVGDPAGPDQAGTPDLATRCRTGADADAAFDCAIVADVNAIQAYWSNSGYARLAAATRGARSEYEKADTVFFRGTMTTACGAADTSQGPFYCPGDRRVYIDLGFYDLLRRQFGARGGPLVNAYVLAHEYGHHVQDLLGAESLVRTKEGPTSGSVRFELQADCYGGVWMNHATQPTADGPPLITGITRSDLASTVDAAGHLGDDFIQGRLRGGTVDPDSFTHGTSAQREKWLTIGFTTGDAQRCNTFSATDLG